MMEIKTRFYSFKNKLFGFLGEPVSAAPLAVFRVFFGLLLVASIVRFIGNGWINTLYVQPTFFFTYYGFAWVQPLGQTGMYIAFAVMLLATIGITFGLFYRVSAVMFFILFTYVELIDKTNYLNHYYFISIMALLLCVLPAKKMFSLDRYFKFTKASNTVPRYAIMVIQLQMALVYFFAGIAKLNADWLLQAMPLKIWLPSKSNIPVIGFILNEPFVAYLFCWCGMLFDISIAFFLFNKKTVWYAYSAVLIFHIATAILFPSIGMFPFIMIVAATIFLPSYFHANVISKITALTGTTSHLIATPSMANSFVYSKAGSQVIVGFFLLHFIIQILLPFRYIAYPEKLFVTEQGYRFSWRVMLMEKAGLVFFYIKNPATGKIIEVQNSDYLTAQQEKQMSTQPDMILQFAHYLQQVNTSTIPNAEIYAEGYVTINGSGSRPFINRTINLATLQDDFMAKNWILAQAH